MPVNEFLGIGASVACSPASDLYPFSSNGRLASFLSILSPTQSLIIRCELFRGLSVRSFEVYLGVATRMRTTLENTRAGPRAPYCVTSPSLRLRPSLVCLISGRDESQSIGCVAARRKPVVSSAPVQFGASHSNTTRGLAWASGRDGRDGRACTYVDTRVKPVFGFKRSLSTMRCQWGGSQQLEGTSMSRIAKKDTGTTEVLGRRSAARGMEPFLAQRSLPRCSSG
ncbi:hypothetical protein C8R47DRAFT_1125442 [Mycena vitilis]|nr:hypothetical protein C8R47DRAFT_1125442 [Mycena vitilis]